MHAHHIVTPTPIHRFSDLIDDLPILKATIPVKAHFTGLLSNVQFSNDKGIFPLSFEYAIFSKGVQRGIRCNY